MMKKNIITSTIAIPFITMGIASCASAQPTITAAATPVTQGNLSATAAKILAKNPGLDKNAVTYALKGYLFAEKQGKVKNPNYLTIINFNKPDTAYRLQVINLNSDEVVFSGHVAQGKGSGGGLMATHFSNAPNSEATSLGTYVTGDVYYGHHGRSEHVIGLEPGINSNAVERAIEIHPAAYVTAQQAGHSWGCFAVNPEKVNQFINIVNGGSVLFAYATPEQNDPNLL